MRKVLYIDFDGTLCADRYWRSLPLELNHKVQELLFRNDTTRVHEWMRGSYTAEEINQYAADSLNVPYEYIWNLFVDDCKTMKVSQDTLEIIHSLRTQFVTVLITGNMDSFTRFTSPALSLEKYFDCISNSYDEHLHKTDKGGLLFQKYAEILNVPVSHSILLDDSKECCDVFKKLGGDIYKVNSLDDTHNVLLSLNRISN